MKLLNLFSRNLVQMLVAMGFIFSAWTGQAKVDLKEQVKLLNKSKSVDNMGFALKNFFKTSKDQRQIDKDIRAMAKTMKKWTWRYELKGNEIAFRSNGKIQFVFKPGNMDKREFTFNGQKFVLNPDLTYASHRDQLLKILNSKQSNLEQLFVRKAQAFFFIAAIIAAAVAVTVSANANAETSSGPSKGEKRKARKCAKSHENSVYQDKSRAFLGNDNSNMYDLEKEHFRTNINDRGYNVVSSGDENSGRGYRSWRKLKGRVMAIIGNYSGYHGADGYIGNNKTWGYRDGVHCQGKECINRCVKAKVRNARGWWAMKNSPARQHCTFAWNIYQNCLQCKNAWQDRNSNCGRTSVVAVVPPPPPLQDCVCNKQTGDFIITHTQGKDKETTTQSCTKRGTCLPTCICDSKTGWGHSKGACDVDQTQTCDIVKPNDGDTDDAPEEICKKRRDDGEPVRWDSQDGCIAGEAGPGSGHTGTGNAEEEAPRQSAEPDNSPSEGFIIPSE